MTVVEDMTRQIEDIVSPYQNSQDAKTWHASSIQIQERAFTQWCNLFLKSKGFEIDNLLDLHDGVWISILLEILSGKHVYNTEILHDESNITRNWRAIFTFLKDESINIPQSPEEVTDETRKTQLLAFIIWRIILRYQIYDESSNEMKPQELDYKRASESLLKWVQSKIAPYPMDNFTSDWTDGVALCLLVNAVRSDTIPESMFRHTNNPEMNVRLACTTAEDELGIPELIAPYDITNGKTEEKSMMTYIALFRSADRMIKRGIKTRTYTSDVSVTSESESECPVEQIEPVNNEIGISYQRPRCVAFGAGLRWGQVGKPAEFIVRLNGAQASALSVSIECRPYDHRVALYKPELQIKPIDETSYIVRYTPTRPGEYVLSIFCGGDHIASSPFRLSVQETVLLSNHYKDDAIIISLDSLHPALTTNILTKSLESTCSVESKADSAFVDDDSLPSLSSGDGSTPPPWLERDCHELYSKISRFIKPENMPITAFGKGLHYGEVGIVGSFNVCTPNTDKGPLSVSITCPAMSIPVPCVKTRLQRTSLLHDVLYLPTEPGIYEIDVKWDEKAVPGSPFCLVVRETLENEATKVLLTKQNKPAIYRGKEKHNILLYYSATSNNVIEHHYKEQLEKLLRKEYPFDKLFCIPIDVELSSKEREELYRVAKTKHLPLVFANDKFIGNFNDVMSLYRKGGLKEFFKRNVETVKRTAARLSSSGNDTYSNRELFD